MVNKLIFVILLILSIVILKKYCNTDREDFGALTQLYAKGPQDVHLMVDVEKYVPEYYWYRHYPYYICTRCHKRKLYNMFCCKHTPPIWNIPTRFYPIYYYGHPGE